MRPVRALHVSHCNFFVHADVVLHPLPGEVLGVPGHRIHRECGIRPKRANGQDVAESYTVMLCAPILCYRVLHDYQLISIGTTEV